VRYSSSHPEPILFQENIKKSPKLAKILFFWKQKLYYKNSYRREKSKKEIKKKFKLLVQKSFKCRLILYAG
jgi:hypothetical protein